MLESDYLFEKLWLHWTQHQAEVYFRGHTILATSTWDSHSGVLVKFLWQWMLKRRLHFTLVRMFFHKVNMKTITITSSFKKHWHALTGICRNLSIAEVHASHEFQPNYWYVTSRFRVKVIEKDPTTEFWNFVPSMHFEMFSWTVAATCFSVHLPLWTKNL